VWRHIQLEDAACDMFHHDRHIQEAKRGRDPHAEATRDDRLSKVAGCNTTKAWCQSNQRASQGISLKHRLLSLPILAVGRCDVQPYEDRIFAELRGWALIEPGQREEGMEGQMEGQMEDGMARKRQGRIPGRPLGPRLTGGIIWDCSRRGVGKLYKPMKDCTY
jgi:hypothetical protein